MISGPESFALFGIVVAGLVFVFGTLVTVLRGASIASRHEARAILEGLRQPIWVAEYPEPNDSVDVSEGRDNQGMT